MSEIREKAEAARDKRAVYGEDIDLEAFEADVPIYTADPALERLSEEEKRHVLEVGIDVSESGRTGSFFLRDHSPIQCMVGQDGVELLPIAEALIQYKDLEQYWWKAVDVGTDKYTAQAEMDPHSGYFLRVKAGVSVCLPVQACLYLSEEGVAQKVHNLIIAEEGAEIHMITGCTTAPHLKRGLHIGVTEIYVAKGATVTSTMLHNWGEAVIVRPRTAVWVEEEGRYMSNYVCFKPAKSVQMYPSVRLKGKNAVARLNTILLAGPGSMLDIGGKVSLEAEGCKAEIISRAITTGGKIISRGMLVGQVPGVRAHLECSGLILSNEGRIHAIPELDGWVNGVDMSHEAAVGKISREEIEYLMARGLTEQEATALIVRGFLNVKMEGLPKELQAEIERMIAETEASVL
ncbi:MAG: SufD family Fe-S cluster assembly protein [Syntrophales bacterium]|jgi:Fe-S cluster assembly scaffold protein SufB|nr:SufD family Fe-S cluster assembly protein [Syntrophales bacterium]